MPTSPDGILTVTFDPDRVAVQIQVDGAAWPEGSDVQRVTVTRSVSGQGAVPVRDLERRAAAGGTLLWVDNECPPDADVTYACIGYDSFGDEVLIGPTNLFTNPSFETNMTGLTWGSEVASVIRTTNGFGVASGAYGLEITGSAAPTATFNSRIMQPLSGSVAPGQWVAFAAMVRRRSDLAPFVALDLDWSGAGASSSDAWSALSSATLSDSSTYVSTVAQAPTGTTGAVARLFFGSTLAGATPGASWGAHSDAWITAVASTQAAAIAAVETYFDGDTPGAVWTGTPHGSTSILPEPTEVTVSTTGAAEGMWVKIPGRADMVTRVAVQDVGEMSRPTLGGSWQVPGGVAIAQSAAASLAQSAGLGSLSTTLRVLSRDAGQTAALWQIVGQAPGQVVLLQTVPQPEELPSGYYQVVNPSQGTLPISPGLYGKRPFSLPITEAVAPAGSGTGVFGVTHDDIAQSFASHTEIAATVSSHLELAQGEWS